jgi:hypothetical protein
MAEQRRGAEPKEDHYACLGVNRYASQAEIAAAYRRMVKKCHPDARPGDPRARQQFLKLQVAFEVLSDPAKRAEYNLTSISFATTRRPGTNGPIWSPPPPWKRNRYISHIVSGPAICLFILGLIGIIEGTFLCLHLDSPGYGVIYVILFAHSIVVMAGALNMLALRVYGLAVLASIAVMLPCIGPFFILGVPCGVWSLVVLNKRTVKSAFWI